MHPTAQDQGPLKDVIISGGPNISSQEVEDVLHGHPSVMMAAVVAQPDPNGRTPCAFIELKEGIGERREIVEFCRARMARFKADRLWPATQDFDQQGQKFLLRARPRAPLPSNDP
jgi:fatty-acyl-CoA synthase